MKTYITLDYELFFGESGTVEKTMIEPTNELLKVLNKHNAKAVFFVDIGFLLRVKKMYGASARLNEDAAKVIQQIKQLASEGHDIQLHIHSHWEDAYFKDEKWHFPMQHYRLHSFSENKILELFKEYKNYLEEISGQNVFAFRAGGWCIQPFDKLKLAFKETGILYDSTVFAKGKNVVASHYYDFKNAPNLTEWKFSKDPCEIDNQGEFTEIPISSYKVSPLFFWKFLFFKKLGGNQHQSFGDGTAVKNGFFQKLRLLFTYSNSVVSIDGFKASYFNSAFSLYKEKYGKGNFVIIGHPKALSPYSLKILDDFLLENGGDIKIMTFKDRLTEEISNKKS